MFANPLSHFQCAAALYQVRPNSALFRLPALCHSDVQEWMRTTFPSELCILQANAGNPIDLARIQNEALRLSLEELRSLVSAQNNQLKLLTSIIQRRTAVLSPAKGYSNETYARRCLSHHFPVQSLCCSLLADSICDHNVGNSQSERKSFFGQCNSACSKCVADQ
jgi:hypothetical protein